MLEGFGYLCTKAGGSLGVWDIIGISSANVVCVQVKSNRRPGSAEMERMREFRVPAGVKKWLVVWVDRKGPNIEEIQ